MKFSIFAVLFTLATSAFAEQVFLRPNETRFINGTQVSCLAQGGGEIGGFSRRAFQCTTVNPSYSSLDNDLIVNIFPQYGDVKSDRLFRFHFQTSCQNLASVLNQRCSTGPCSITFCEAQNPSYATLDSTLYQLRSYPDGRLEANAIQSYRFMSECRQAGGY